MKQKKYITGHEGIRTWVEINTQNIKQNHSVFKYLINKECKFMSVIKSNAYGHGLAECGKIVEKLGSDFIGVDSVTEALALKKNNIKTPVLILGYTLSERIPEVVKEDIRITLSNFEVLDTILKTKNNIKIHVKIDTGMHRQGFLLEQLPDLIKKLSKNEKIIVEGIYSHFAAAKNEVFRSVTEKQIVIFQEACKIFNKNGFSPIRHIAATAGVLNYPSSHFDMVRVGIGNFGLWPIDECKAKFKNKIELKPALTWKTIIAEIKQAKKGEGIGYDLSEKLKRNSRIAILPIGYWHGYRRNLSRVGEVLIRGKRAKVLGRVCMDMFIVDITDIPKVKICDEVVIIGKSEKENISVEEIARACKTSNYEIITQINPLIKRIYL